MRTQNHSGWSLSLHACQLQKQQKYYHYCLDLHRHLRPKQLQQARSWSRSQPHWLQIHKRNWLSPRCVSRRTGHCLLCDNRTLGSCFGCMVNNPILPRTCLKWIPQERWRSKTAKWQLGANKCSCWIKTGKERRLQVVQLLWRILQIIQEVKSKTHYGINHVPGHLQHYFLNWVQLPTNHCCQLSQITQLVQLFRRSPLLQHLNCLQCHRFCAGSQASLLSVQTQQLPLNWKVFLWSTSGQVGHFGSHQHDCLLLLSIYWWTFESTLEE